MAVRQTDSEPSAAESTAESAAESTDESRAVVSRGNQESTGNAATPEIADTGGSAMRPAAGYVAAVRAEQDYVSMLYGLLDQARERSQRELAGVRAGTGAGGTHQARLERDISASEHAK